MSDYIVCQKKRNNPRMNIRICQHKCAEKDDCQEFLSHSKTTVQSEGLTLTADGQTVAMSPA
jgi:hypothetical protein